MIALGCDYGGPEHKQSLIHSGLHAVMNAVAELRAPNYDDGSQAWMNPIFLVPGSLMPRLDTPAFKLGHFSKTKKGLVVMISVPAAVANGEGIPEFVEDALFKAVELAGDKFDKHGIAFSRTSARDLLERAFNSIPGWRPHHAANQ